jgi:hypothetical protein
VDKDTRNAIERATQKARRLLEDDFVAQLEGTYDVLSSGVVAAAGGPHLTPGQQLVREKIVAAIEHKRAAGAKAGEAVTGYVRDAAFTTLNRFAALKMLEARGLLQECLTKGVLSSGYGEFCGLAPGVALLPDGAGYRLYLESLFDELSTEIKVLFDRRDPASALWPKRQTFEDLLAALNAPELAAVWNEDETIGWVYQFFNSGDERRAMRDESQAPRNSHELAVRNQFFTPRYVVRFLAENTLARMWIEMMGEGGTRIAEKCEFLVKGVESRGPRTKKDPRDLKLLDPACGSGHFLLYAFDLFLTIYEDAWHDKQAATRAVADGSGRTLCQDYPDFDALRRAMPALILAENLHGVDIDPRCAQIAALALWLRAQRAYKELGVAAGERPRITRTHIVVAEPMHGDAALVEAFAVNLEPPLLRGLFTKMVEEMKLAGELGSLIRVDKGIAEELSRAREEWNRQREPGDYLPTISSYLVQGLLDLSQIDDAGFFQEAEARLLAALRRFAESATGGAGVRRRLFAEDAAQGIALIDLLRMKFDVILMNPPFGTPTKDSRSIIEAGGLHGRDLASDFVTASIELSALHGHVGAITTRTIFFLKGFRDWREAFVRATGGPQCFLDLGFGVLDAAVETSAFTAQLGRHGVAGAYLCGVGRAKDFDSNGPRALLACTRYAVDARVFEEIPRGPFAYWASKEILEAFQHSPRVGDVFEVLSGGNPRDDFRFVRLWSEPAASLQNREWVPYSKGGEFARFFFDVHLTLRWREGGHELKAQAADYRASLGWSPDWRALIMNYDRYFTPAITWPRRTSSVSFRALPAGCVFGDKSPVIVTRDGSIDTLLPLLGFLNTRALAGVLELMVGGSQLAQSFEVGIVAACPVPSEVVHSQTHGLGERARRAWTLSRTLQMHHERSRAFALPALLLVADQTIVGRAAAVAERMQVLKDELAEIGSEIERKCFELHGIDPQDLRGMSEGFGDVDGIVAAPDVESEAQVETDTEAAETYDIDTVSLVTELLSWSFGTAFGRFDVRLASGERPLPTEPDPFDPLPVCSPGMLTGDDGLPLAAPPPGYPLDFPSDGILVDDPGHPRDLTARARAVFDVIFGADCAARWDEAAELLDPRSRELRPWLAASFFECHLKRYSRSRRKAPILWQLATPSASYSVWLYVHRLTKDSFFHVLHDVVSPKLAHEERKHATLASDAGPNPSAAARKTLAAQELFRDELRAFRDEVARIAPLWNPELNDGVLLTAAPLWRLFPQHRAWQKELKAAWDALASGRYDWAHLAMHLWPERVVPSCAKDRSFAIAHGLEDVFWIEETPGKWKPRKDPLRAVDELIRERTSTAVKAALVRMDEAPANGTSAARRSRRRAI